MASTTSVLIFAASQTIDLVASMYVSAGEFQAASPGGIEPTEATKQHVINAFNFLSTDGQNPLYAGSMEEILYF